MPRTALALLPISVALALALGPAAADAAPADDSDAPSDPSGNSYSPRPGIDSANARRAAAIDAAFGTPPATSRPDPETSDDPGYSSRRSGGTPDQTYGSTARSLGATGEAIEGLEIYDRPIDEDEAGYADQVPDVHVVQRGDTLWDISSYYLRDAHAWPRLWSWNEHVTNAHWIFPGDRIRLYDPRFGPGGDDVPDFRYSKTRVPDGSGFETLLLNQFAFVDVAEFDTSMKIVGGGEANVMMATLDTVYMKYDRVRPPVPGERLVVYAPQEKVYEVRTAKDGSVKETKNVIGYIVQIMGEVEVESIARKTAEGTIATAHNPIERGYRVGPLRRQFRRIDEVPAEQSAAGVVVATLNDTSPFPLKGARARKSLLGDYVMVGETQFMVVNIGSAAGLQVGNVLEVVRKGDEFTKKRVFHIPYEDGWPRRVIGAAVVLQTQNGTALLATTYSRREIERGDHVELRGPELLRSERSEADALRHGTDGRPTQTGGTGTGRVQVGGGTTTGGATTGGTTAAGTTAAGTTATATTAPAADEDLDWLYYGSND